MTLHERTSSEALSVPATSPADSTEAQRLALLMRATRDAVWDCDLLSGSVWWNDAYRELFGRPPETAGSWQWWYDRIHPDDVTRVKTTIEAALESDADRWECEYRFCLPSEEYAVILDRGCIARDGAGRATRILGAMRDVSEQRDAVAALRRSEERFRATFEQAGVGIAHMDAGGAFLRVNDRLCQILGCTRQDLLTRTFQEITHPDDLGADLEQARRLVAGQIPGYTMHKRYLRSDGSPVWVALSVAPQRGPDGRIDSYIAVVQDIDTQKRAEVRLIEADRLAAIGALAAGIGHDMSNVVMGMSMHLAKKREHDASRSEQGDADAALRAGLDYLTKLSSGLRQLARRRTTREAGSVSLPAWWSELSPLFRTGVPAGVQLSSDIPPDLPRVAVADHMLTKAILNLIVNAGEAIAGAQREEGTVIIRARPAANGTTAPAQFIDVSVIDDGPGMTSEIRQHCLDPFFTTKKRLSTGMGMTLVKGVADEARGSLILDTAPGRGTTVTLRLPAAD